MLLDALQGEGPRCRSPRRPHAGRTGSRSTLTRGGADQSSAPATPTPILTLLGEGDYLALLAYLGPDRALASELQRFRIAVRDRTRAATMFGYGPRYLHSTGQLHKGGPNSGVFVLSRPTPTRTSRFPAKRFRSARSSSRRRSAISRRSMRPAAGRCTCICRRRIRHSCASSPTHCWHESPLTAWSLTQARSRQRRALTDQRSQAVSDDRRRETRCSSASSASARWGSTW